MPILLIALWAAVLSNRWLQAHAPSNQLIRLVRWHRPSLPVAGSLLTLSAILAGGAFALARSAANGPGWLNLLVVIALWDSFKFCSLSAAVILRYLLTAQNGKGLVSA